MNDDNLAGRLLRARQRAAEAEMSLAHWTEVAHNLEEEIASSEPDFGAVIMFCYEYANGSIGTIVAIRAQDTGQWKTTSRRTSRIWPMGVSWRVMQDLFPAIKRGHWVRMVAEDKEFNCG